MRKKTPPTKIVNRERKGESEEEERMGQKIDAVRAAQADITVKLQYGETEWRYWMSDKHEWWLYIQDNVKQQPELLYLLCIAMQTTQTLSGDTLKGAIHTEGQKPSPSIVFSFHFQQQGCPSLNNI